jgi:hypothetical protein
MALPPFQKLYSPTSELFTRGQDNVAESLRVLGTKSLLITDESALFLEATVTVPTDWVTPTLLNSWVDFGGSLATVQYRKAADGSRVDGKGTATGGTGMSTAVYAIPAAYRPAADLGFATVSNSAFAFFEVRSGGNVFTLGGSTSDYALNFSFTPADRNPVPLSCWPIQIPCALSARPNAVLLAEARQTGTNTYVSAGNPDWEWSSQAGQNFLVVRNVPFLPPSATYDLTFAVFGVT